MEIQQPELQEPLPHTTKLVTQQDTTAPLEAERIFGTEITI